MEISSGDLEEDLTTNESVAEDEEDNFVGFKASAKTPNKDDTRHFGKEDKLPFELVKKIGKGAFGTIYKAKNLENGQLAAVKVLRFCNNKELEEISKERNALLLCKGAPFVVTYQGTFIIQNRTLSGINDLWLIMEFCGGGSLMQVIENLQRPLQENEIRLVCKQILEAFLFLHEFLIHRDVKAANILLTCEGEVKLADFGEVTLLSDLNSQNETIPKRRSGVEQGLKGTPYFLPPEVLENILTPKIDIWALGITAIELAEGQPPYADRTPMNYMFLLVTDIMQKPPNLSKPENFSPSFSQFIKRCLTVNLDVRPSAIDLLQDNFVAQKIDQNPLKELYGLTIARKIPKKPKKESSAIAEGLLKDPETGKSMEEWLENLLQMKEKYNSHLVYFLEQKVKKNEESVEKVEKKSSEIKESKLQHKIITDKSLKKEIDTKKFLFHLAHCMTHPKFGVIVMAREVRNKVYQECMIGKECVDWLSFHLYLSRGNALAILNYFVEDQLLVPLSSYSSLDSSWAIFRINSHKLQVWSTKYKKPIKLEVRVGEVHVHLDDFHSPNFHNKNSSKKLITPINSIQTLLTERDWKEIEHVGNILTFKKGQVVISPSEKNRCLYRLEKGNLSIQVGLEEKKLVFEPLRGDTFNDLSLVEQMEETYELVTVTSNEAEICVIQINQLMKLLKSKSALSFRFFQSMSVTLARRVHFQRKLLAGKEDKKHAQRAHDKIMHALKDWVSSEEFSAKDLQFFEIFNLPTDELVLHEFACSFGKLNKQRGDLFVSKHFLCFSSHSQKYKVKIRFSEILSISIANKQSIRVKTSSYILPFLFYDFSNLSLAYNQVFEHFKRNSSSLSPSNSASISVSEQHKQFVSSSLSISEQPNSLSNQNSKESPKENSNKILPVKMMTNDDWNVLNSISHTKKFNKGQIILPIGTEVKRFHQLVKGTCQINYPTLQMSFQYKVGDLWGEVSLLSETPSEAEVVALENVEMVVFDYRLLSILFLRSPSLGAKFYFNTICSNIAEKYKVLLRESSVISRTSHSNF